MRGLGWLEIEELSKIYDEKILVLYLSWVVFCPRKFDKAFIQWKVVTYGILQNKNKLIV